VDITRIQRYDVVPRCRPLLRVEWWDAHSGSQWSSPESLDRKPWHCVRVGYYVGRSERALTVVAGYGGEQGDSPMTLPVAGIQSVRYMGERWTP